jgi:hypothetical protein
MGRAIAQLDTHFKLFVREEPGLGNLGQWALASLWHDVNIDSYLQQSWALSTNLRVLRRDHMYDNVLSKLMPLI